MTVSSRVYGSASLRLSLLLRGRVQLIHAHAEVFLHILLKVFERREVQLLFLRTESGVEHSVYRVQIRVFPAVLILFGIAFVGAALAVLIHRYVVPAILGVICLST